MQTDMTKLIVDFRNFQKPIDTILHVKLFPTTKKVIM